jgi:hypothetical protein
MKAPKAKKAMTAKAPNYEGKSAEGHGSESPHGRNGERNGNDGSPLNGLRLSSQETSSHFTRAKLLGQSAIQRVIFIQLMARMGPFFVSR